MNTSLSLLFIVLVSAPANAAPASYPGAEACSADVKKFCAGVKPGGGAIHQCLKQHEAELTPGCAQFRDAANDKIKSFVQACGADMRTYCNKVQPGEGRVVQCLKKHQDALTTQCRAQLTTAR